MTVLFPSHPLKAALPDPDFEDEFTAAKAAGFRCAVFSLEHLRAGNIEAAMRHCRASESTAEPILHRCWMMGSELYSNLHAALVEKGYRPAVSPPQYEQSHYLPKAYPFLKYRTPETEWMEGKDEDQAWQLYQSFRDRDAIIKDWVKSAKHRWRDACFIPAQANRQKFGDTFKAFVAARGTLFEKGVVLRRYHNLIHLETDLKGQPVHEEYRMFFWKGRLLAATPPIRDEGPFLLLDDWQQIAAKFGSPFITVDVARERSGNWLIIEVGDAGVSGLPLSIETGEFYQTLFERLSR